MPFSDPASIFEDYGNLTTASLSDNFGQITTTAGSVEDYENESTEYIGIWSKSEFLRLRELGYI